MTKASRVGVRHRALTTEIPAEPTAIETARSAAVETAAAKATAAAETTKPKRWRR